MALLLVARMLHEDVRDPRGIACITFSNECARELERRLAVLGLADRENLFVGTIHAFCLQHIIIPYAHLTDLTIPAPITVAKESDQLNALGKALSEVRWGQRPQDYMKDFNILRQNRLDSTQDHPPLSAAEVQILRSYESSLRQRGLIDFEDMILLGQKLIDEQAWIRDLLVARFPILVVDEYQDLGIALHLIVQRLCFDAGIRLFAVGDPDQSIYGFLGAQPNLLEQLVDRPDIECIKLRLNYRCGTKIVQASQFVVAGI